jgi:tetratricopeptide (TPR) repeat protein
MATIGSVALTLSAMAAPGASLTSTSPAASESARLRARGLEAGYNLDHAEALAAFRAASEADPEDPAPHRLLAATLWINLLFQQGAVSIEDYLGQARESSKRTPPSADLDRAFRDHIKRALTLAEARVRLNPADADARFQLGAAHSFLASYIATVEGRGLAAFRAARGAYHEHQRVMELDARRKDAGMVVGMYRYGVSTLPLHWRLLAGIAGFGGGRDRGLRLVEESASYPSDVQTNARFTLVLIYNREKRYDDALRVVAELQRAYPRNRLLWLEAGSTNLRAGRPADAMKALEEGLAKLPADRRPRAFGEEARWRYACGAALVAQQQTERAERELRAVLNVEAQAWVRGRAHSELGKLADLAGNRAAAMEHYRLAIRIARAEDDSTGAEEAARLLKAGYRQP